MAIGSGGLLSVRQVAAFLGVSTATIYKLCASGRLSAVRVGAALRVAPEELSQFLTAMDS